MRVLAFSGMKCDLHTRILIKRFGTEWAYFAGDFEIHIADI